MQGRDLDLSADDLRRILQNRSWYYRQLNNHFQHDLLFACSFFSGETFINKSEEGVQEMPVLVSSSVVQLTFGLPDFTLSFYRYIRIYPAEFISDELTRILVGNVASNIVTAARSHFPDGYEDQQDGANLGLHEIESCALFPEN